MPGRPTLLLERRQRAADRAAALAHHARGQERDVHRPGVLVGDPLPQLLGLRVGQLRRRVRVDVDRVARAAPAPRCRASRSWACAAGAASRARTAVSSSSRRIAPGLPTSGVRAAHGPQRQHVGARLRRLAAHLVELLLELGDPPRERLQRVGDRVGQVDPVGVRPLGLAPLDPDRYGRGCRPPSSSAARRGRRPRWRRSSRRGRSGSARAAWRRSRSSRCPRPSGGACRSRSRCRRASRPGRASRSRRSRPSRRPRRPCRGR